MESVTLQPNAEAICQGRDKPAVRIAVLQPYAQGHIDQYSWAETNSVWRVSLCLQPNAQAICQGRNKPGVECGVLQPNAIVASL